jgi:hypothetical protein
MREQLDTRHFHDNPTWIERDQSSKIDRTRKDPEKLLRALDALVAWAEKWGTEFDVRRCKVVHTGLHNNHQKKLL